MVGSLTEEIVEFLVGGISVAVDFNANFVKQVAPVRDVFCRAACLQKCNRCHHEYESEDARMSVIFAAGFFSVAHC